VEGIGSVSDVHIASDRPLISVVVPVRNGLPWLDDQLRALAAQELPGRYEVVVADNGSNDGSIQLVEQWSARDDRIRLVDASAQPGPSVARNVGARSARAALLAFCDADDVVAPGWLAAAVDALSGSDLVAGAFDFGVLQGRPPSPPTPAATGQLGFLPFALGANLAVRRDAFEAVRGFREDLRVGEDIDLSWRLQLAGYRFAVADSVIVDKREQAGGWRTLRAAFGYGKSGPLLFRHYRAHGMRRDTRGALKAWLWLVVTSPGLVVPARRQQWARTFGIRAGRLAGSVGRLSFFP